MLRQVCNRQGRMIKPLQAIIFLAAMLLFIFTVVYRMVKSDSFSTALATLIESLLIVAFFIFIGIVSAYLLYFIYHRIRQGSNRHQMQRLFGEASADNNASGNPDGAEIALEAREKAESQPNS